MGEVIYLREHRKKRSRLDKAVQSAANRLRHGSAKADKERVKKESDRAERDLDGKKRDDRE